MSAVTEQVAATQGAIPPESLGYRLKRRLLGPPLTNDTLRSERLSRVLALGVLAPDCISSSAYGTEEMLIELLPAFGLLAFTLVLPITGVILAILVLLTLSYRQVVTVYTRAGGSYVVARDNFGPRVAQVAAVALLIDYVVTVAVQTAAGTVAVASAFPVLGPYSLEITVGVVAVLAFGNLRGIREAGRLFAFPTYFFVAALGCVIVAGLVRQALGILPQYHAVALVGTVPVHHRAGLTELAITLTLARSFANGGSSLTGLEAISNGVSAFRPPEGRHARTTLVAMAGVLGFLVAGVSWLAHATHATPYSSGYPSVISQEARLVVGGGPVGHVLYFLVQAASALILYTGANTSFNGFPYLASFVAADSFLPRPLTRRGHRLAFSTGILLLAGISIVLLLATDARVNSLVPFYAIGVFTGFTMAGFGMARYHAKRREAGWRRGMVVNAAAGGMSALVVLIFAVVKFTEGAWLVVVIFPLLVVALIRLNKRYRNEEEALTVFAPMMDTSPAPARHAVLVLVDELDVATLGAVRYARILHPNTLIAVHFVVDSAHAQRLADRWREIQRGDVPLQLRDCPDRRVGRAALDLTATLVADGRTEVTVVLPRRVYGARGWLLHNRRADRIAALISRVPHAVATIIPYDVDAAIRKLQRVRRPSVRAAPGAAPPPAVPVAQRPLVTPGPLHDRGPGRGEGPTLPVSGLHARKREVTEGVIKTVSVRPVSNSQVLEVELADPTGCVLLRFYGRGSIPGIRPGQRLRVHGTVGRYGAEAAIANPHYELIDGS